MNFKWKGEKKKEENSALQFDVLLATNCSKWAYYRVDTVFCLPETAMCSGPGFLSLLSTKSVGARLTFLKHIHGFAVRPTFRPYFAEELLRSFTSYWVSTWHLRTEKLKWSTVPSCCAFYARSETLWNKSDIALVHSTSYYWPLRGCRSLGPPSGLAALGRTSWPATTQRPISNLSHAHTGDILYLFHDHIRLLLFSQSQTSYLVTCSPITSLSGQLAQITQFPMHDKYLSPASHGQQAANLKVLFRSHGRQAAEPSNDK